jgi:hypothetical protein
VEDYYRDSYPVSMRAKVAEILPDRSEHLRALFGVLIHDVSAQYRTVPDVRAVEAALREVDEAYPELRAESQDVPLLEDAPAGTELADWFAAWREAVASGENPRDAEAIKRVLREHGV